MNIKILIGGLVVLCLLGAGYFFFAKYDGLSQEVQRGGEFMIGEETWMRQSDAEIGMQFTYRTNPNGYVLEVQDDELASDTHIKAYTLILQSDQAEMSTGVAPREFPPTITVNVFRNTDDMFPGQWAAEYPEYSNIELALTEVGSVTVGGAQGVRYTADGLYATDTIVIAHGSYIYVVAGAFIEESSQIRQDFEPFVNALVFIPIEENNESK